MFELHEVPAKLTSYNPFAEKHGEDPQPAASASFRLNLDATALDAIHPALRPMFYYKAGRDHVADLADVSHDAPNLRAGAKLKGPFAWAARWAGYVLRIHVGTRSAAHILIPGCEVDKVKFDPQEGGTVIVQFSAVFHPDEKTGGKLGMMIERQWDISLTAPEGVMEIKPKTEEPAQPAPRDLVS